MKTISKETRKKMSESAQCTSDEIVARIADHLIANGVTVQKRGAVAELARRACFAE